MGDNLLLHYILITFNFNLHLILIIKSLNYHISMCHGVRYFPQEPFTRSL
jgi:hypothetical protein